MMTYSQIPYMNGSTEQLPAVTTQLSKVRTRRRFSGGIGRMALMVAFWFCTALFASHAHAAKAPIYTSFLNNNAVGGYDAVSYFQGNQKPVKGKKKFSTSYKGANWKFASKENLETFLADPEKYAPQYGGYCAYAVALGDTVKGDPLQYHISDNKLYLNINRKYKNIWLKDKDNFIAKGDQQWPTLLE